MYSFCEFVTTTLWDTLPSPNIAWHYGTYAPYYGPCYGPHTTRHLEPCGVEISRMMPWLCGVWYLKHGKQVEQVQWIQGSRQARWYARCETSVSNDVFDIM